MDALKKFDTFAVIVLALLIALDGLLWFFIITELPAAEAHAYFLDVGQGDSELVVFSGNIKVMTDAGPDGKIIESLGKTMREGDRYIDVAIVSHPQLDHFNGFNYLLNNGYRFGVFVYNGRDDGRGVKEWPALLKKISDNNIPLITLKNGDGIRTDNGRIDLLSPDKAFAQSAELNDTGFVELIKTPELRALFMADTGFNVEIFLMKSKKDIRAHVLKVGHHGSKFSSGTDFLRQVSPRVAVIEVGAKNHYGHPSKQALGRLASSTDAAVFRTDQNGTVDVSVKNGKIVITKEKG
jgi:competence protein ComEC